MSNIVEKLTVAPLPEAIDGEKWKITEGGRHASMTFIPRQMIVPLSSSARDRFVRLHEQAHAKWTPRAKDPVKEAAKLGVPWNYIQAAEDGRIHQRLRSSAGFTNDDLIGGLDDREADSIVRRFLEQPDPLSPYVTTLFSTIGTSDSTRLVAAVKNIIASDSTPPATRELAKHIDERGKQVVREAYRVLCSGRKGKEPEFADTLRAAKYLYDALGAEQKRPEEKNDKSDKGEAMKDAGEETKAEEKISEESDELLKRLRAELANQPKFKVGNKWGKAQVQVLPMTVTNKAALTSRRNRAYDVGAIPRYMHRMCSDRRVFSQKRKARGGTVLIDTSGSMSINTFQIDYVLERAPCATIAMYSGNDVSGYISIIARNGHRAEAVTIDKARKISGFGNIIDGPALRWLTKQEEPRIWVCDGYVTGCHDTQSSNLLAEAGALVMYGRVKRISTMDEAMKKFDKVRRGHKL